MQSELTVPSIRQQRSTRLLSLDAFRGLTVAAMILVNNPGDWDHIYPPLEHARWHGWTPTDLIFPFFLFIVGVSITFALGGVSPREQRSVRLKILKRSAVLFGLGLFLNLFPRYDFHTVRIMGVLQRIALVYLACSFIYLRTNAKQQGWLIAILLIGYWVLLTAVPVPGLGYATLDAETNLGAWLDRLLLTPAHLWKTAKVWDPEGLLGTLPAIATGLSGMLAGRWLQSERSRSGIPADRNVAGLMTAGLLSALAGWALDPLFPINKALWTSTFVLLTSGLAATGLGLCYYVIDVLGYRRFATLPVAFGVNAITVFFLSGLIPRMMTLININGENSKTWLYQTFFVPLFQDPRNASLAGALTFVAIWAAVTYWMWRSRVIVKV